MRIKKFQICILCVCLSILFSGCGEVKNDLHTPYNEEEIIQKQFADLPKDSEEDAEHEADVASETEPKSEPAFQVLPEEEQHAAASPESEMAETEEQDVTNDIFSDLCVLQPDYFEESENSGEEVDDDSKNAEEQALPAQTNICTLTVRCDTVLSNMEKLAKEKIPLVPQDGVIYAKRELEYKTGESVFDLLRREMAENRIHMEFAQSTGYKSAYVEGINNLYEFDCGDLSGWVYTVNGKVGNVGCSQYVLQPGDVVEWVYTCDMGRDVN